jgi:hypothetical protein
MILTKALIATASIGGPSLIESGETDDFKFDFSEAEQTISVLVLSNFWLEQSMFC